MPQRVPANSTTKETGLRGQAEEKDREAAAIEQQLDGFATSAREGAAAATAAPTVPTARSAPARRKSSAALTVNDAILQTLKGTTGRNGFSAGTVHQRVSALRPRTPYGTVAKALQSLANRKKIRARGARPRKYFERR